MSINNKIDLLVSFDTTGSMYPVLAQVREEVEKFVKQMFSEFTDLRLGIIAHGDYCDAGNPYTIISKDFTRDSVGLCRFIRETKKTCGGDADECYELVLNTAHKDLTWRDDADKVMIMIGDASPHGVYYSANKSHLDWKEEAKTLAAKGVKVFAVHALSYYRNSSKEFYKTVANTTDGVYLTLDQFNEVIDLIKATCYQQGGEEKLNEFITIIRDNGKMTNSMDRNFRRLRGEEVVDTYERYSKPFIKRGVPKSTPGPVTIKEMDKLVPVIPGRFQVMAVDVNCDIKGFVTKNGIEFKKGRGFYELSKAETVQQYKEVIIQDRETGEMFTGSQVREELGLQPQSESGGVKERLHKDKAKKYRVFVQSTSVNRKLIGGTTFLYEVSDIEDTGTVIDTVEAPVVEEVKIAEVAEHAETPTEDPVAEEVSTVETVDETPVKKKRIRKSKNTAPVPEETAPVFEETAPVPDVVESPEIVSEAEVKKEKTKKTKKVDTDKKDKEAAKLEAKAKAKTEKAMAKVEDCQTKLADALDRYKVSTNKKNTAYLVNNIKKCTKALEELAGLVDNK